MNKYLTFPGQQPVYLGDIDFLQESVRSAFMMLLKGLTGQEQPSCILKKATSNNDGVICLNGEIMPYKPYTGSWLGNKSYEVVTLHAGDRIFKDGVTHACYETRYAQEVLGNGPAFPALDELLFARLQTETVAENDTTDTSMRIARYKTIGNFVTVENVFEFYSESTLEYLCQSVVTSRLNNSVISQSPIYCNFVAESNGTLMSLPAKVTLEASSTSPEEVIMTIKINRTRLSAGTKGSLSFTVVK